MNSSIFNFQMEEERVAGVLSRSFDDDLAMAQALQREFDREYELSAHFEAGETGMDLWRLLIADQVLNPGHSR